MTIIYKQNCWRIIISHRYHPSQFFFLSNYSKINHLIFSIFRLLLTLFLLSCARESNIAATKMGGKRGGRYGKLEMQLKHMQNIKHGKINITWIQSH